MHDSFDGKYKISVKRSKTWKKKYTRLALDQLKNIFLVVLWCSPTVYAPLHSVFIMKSWYYTNQWAPSVCPRLCFILFYFTLLFSCVPFDFDFLNSKAVIFPFHICAVVVLLNLKTACHTDLHSKLDQEKYTSLFSSNFTIFYLPWEPQRIRSRFLKSPYALEDSTCDTINEWMRKTKIK